MKNEIIKWKCNFGGCGKVYSDSQPERGYDGYSDSYYPYCPSCGHRVYLITDTIGSYDE